MSESEAERRLLRELFDVAVAAAMPAGVLPAHLPAPPTGRTLIVGAGKASAAMAAALETHWQGPPSGLVLTRYGHAVPCCHIEIVEAAHPVPDAAGTAAAGRILALAKDLDKDDLMIALISGGGSSLLTLPAAGISLADKQAVNRALLSSGVPIGEMNVLRKHISAIKGGRLAAAAYPARCVALMISDVPGDDMGTIASGPTVADGSTLKDARAVLARLGPDMPESVIRALNAPQNETPKPGDLRLANTSNTIIAAPMRSLKAAAAQVESAGFRAKILGDALEGEARDLGRQMAKTALERQARGQRVALISGGETTVTLRGSGRGGRNVEFLIGLAEVLNGAPGIFALAADTDGVDGAEEIAGAIITPDTLARAAELGYPLGKAMDNNDGHGFFAALGDQVITGPTLTNVNDFRVILVTPPT
jgi:glycerate 2-kinase